MKKLMVPAAALLIMASSVFAQDNGQKKCNKKDCKDCTKKECKKTCKKDCCKKSANTVAMN